MATTPFSVRFSEALTKVVQGLSASAKKTPSDFIREAVEEKAYRQDSHRNLVAPLVMDRQKTLSKIREKMEKRATGETSEPISRVEISAMMIFWHQAYLTGSGSANPSYVMVLLDITRELLQEAKTKRLNFDFHYSHSKLGLEAVDQGYEASFADLKSRFMESPSIPWAEILARPLSAAADQLDLFSEQSISHIFTGFRLEYLLPLAVRGVGAELSDRLISMDMRQLLPDGETFQIGGLRFMLSAEPFALVVEGTHHCYAFESASVMSLFLFSETDQPLMQRDKFEVQLFQGQAIIHESGGYRLHLAESEFMELRENLKMILKNQRWDWLLKRFRNLKGDV